MFHYASLSSLSSSLNNKHDIAIGLALFCSIAIMMIPTAPVESMTMLRVASWNILAQDYVKEYKYPWTKDTPGCLEWDYRKQKIAEWLLDEEMKPPDVVCLQEAQINIFSDLLSSLSPIFDGVIQNTTSGHNVGTAVLVRNSCPVKLKRMESRSRALIVTLEDKQQNDNNLYLCSVHLDADKSHDPKKRQIHQDQRQCQLKSLLKRINFQCKLDEQQIKESSVLIAGDFNMLRENPLHSILMEGTLSPSAHVPLQDAYMEAERNKRQSIPVYQQHQEESSSGEETNIQQQQQQKNDNHQLNLAKTYKGGAILDYIWTSEKIKVLDTLLYHPRSSIMGTEKWPSAEHPSDHIPIGIDMEWN
jgi:mRNA deadenylase 3'-5' endonuclease subunit Ccr4